MKQISELESILSGFLFWNKARLACFSRMLLALFAVRTVNLKEIAVAFASDVKVESRYKRLKRFFKDFTIDFDVISRWIFHLFFSGEKKLYITIDRTNWFWGKTKINILTLAVAYEGIAVPLQWTLLNKAGNASAEEHIAIIKRFIDLFGSDCIEGILGDREFATGSLFKWLDKQKIPFYIRIKDNAQVCIRNKKLRSAQSLFNYLNPNRASVFGMTLWVYGQKVYLAGARSERGELMIVVTNRHPRNAIAIYLRRWEVETLFQSLKTRGFRFEETHMLHMERIQKLMALLAIGFCWAHKVGEWAASKKAIPFNQHRDSQRPQYSYFRYGLDIVRDAIFSCISSKGTKPLLNCIKLLKIPHIFNLSALEGAIS